MIYLIFNPAIDSKLGVTPNLPTGAATVFQTYIAIFIRLAYIGGLIVFTFMLLSGALEYITAGGEKDKTANASKRITNALIGLFLLFAVFAITSLVKVLFGIDVLNFVIPTLT
jgi:hypothetical protein